MKTTTPRDNEAGLGLALSTIDEAIRKAGNPGEPGSGLYLLLSTVASQFLGVPHGSMTPAPEAEAEDEDEAKRQHDEAEARAKAAEANAKHSRR